MMMGVVTFNRYADTLRQAGIDLNKVVGHKCKRYFRFGNSEVSESQVLVYLPVFFRKKYGLLVTYLVEGDAPALFPRPLMESFDITVSYRRQELSWGDDPPEPALVDEKGHYVVDLLADLSNLVENEVNLDKSNYVFEPVDMQNTLMNDYSVQKSVKELIPEIYQSEEMDDSMEEINILSRTAS